MVPTGFRHLTEALMETVDPLPFPPIARFRFRFFAYEPIRLPSYPGSAWRGLLGNGLRRSACVTRQPTCTGCLLVQSCVYSTLFETPAPPGLATRGYSAMPHPFVLDIDPRAPSMISEGAPFDLTINLIGQAITQVPYLIHAFNVAGERGIGGSRGRFGLAEVERERNIGSDLWDPVFSASDGTYLASETRALQVPALPARVRVCLTTPLRIKRDGHFIGARELSPRDLMRVLYQRLRRLAELYGGDPAVFDAPKITMDDDALLMTGGKLQWHDWTRFSSRQNTLMEMGGLVGELELIGPALASVWPALWLGQWTHVGKGTAFGLGGYHINEPMRDASSDRQPRDVPTDR
jgi:hypothetical protein